MTDRPCTPVVLFIYNRPELTARVVEVLSQVEPTTLYVVADGPRPGDEAACRAAQAVVESVDWPGTVHRWYSATNRGNRVQITDSLDEVFSEERRAIIVEDDVVAHPRFFRWCESLLDRYDDDAEVQQVSGRNELGRWDAQGDHLLARRGSVWGWATWASAWRTARQTSFFHAPQVELERLLLDHVRAQQLLLGRGRAIGWDNEWTLRFQLNGWLSAVPPLNLVRNIGFGAGASHTVTATDVRGALDVMEPGTALDHGEVRPTVDDRYDRWSLLVELMSSYTNPAAARRLAQAPRVLERVAGDEHGMAMHHLAPFHDALEAGAVLEHLRPHLGASETFLHLADVMAEAAARQPARARAVSPQAP
ncbi:MAG: hypothetical protein JO291_13450 [Acidimicrobiia bacterium]|nr:hypothetical protein [Acidimicrobiia bacterium]